MLGTILILLFALLALLGLVLVTSLDASGVEIGPVVVKLWLLGFQGVVIDMVFLVLYRSGLTDAVTTRQENERN